MSAAAEVVRDGLFKQAEDLYAAKRGMDEQAILARGMEEKARETSCRVSVPLVY